MPLGWTERISTNGTTTTIGNHGALVHGGTKSLLTTGSSNTEDLKHEQSERITAHAGRSSSETISAAQASVRWVS